MSEVSYTDSDGERLQIGDTVRIIGVPDLSGMAETSQQESLPVFRYLVGKYKRIASFDEHGFAWLHFKILKGAHHGFHFVAIEPSLLKRHKSQTRKV